MNNLEALTAHLEENARIDAIPAEQLAGLYLEQYGTPTVEELEKNILIEWAEQVDGGQYQYADTVEDFARSLFDDLSEWTEENEIFRTLAPHVKWLDVYKTELRHDWTAYYIEEEKQYLFVIMP